MYDMYPWDKDSAADAAAATDAAAAEGTAAIGAGPRTGSGAGQPGPAIDAVQVALDRRDNGGDAAAPPGRPTASPARH